MITAKNKNNSREQPLATYNGLLFPARNRDGGHSHRSSVFM